MTFGELIKNTKDRVRSDSNLTLYFIAGYQYLFSIKPTCAGCSINKELDKFKREVIKRDLLDTEILINEKNIPMDNSKTFLKSANLTENMLVFTDKDGIKRRKFVNKLNDDFVIGYLTFGSEQELIERKKKFKVLPIAMREEKKEIIEVVEVQDEVNEIEEIQEVATSNKKNKRRKNK